MKGPLHGNDGNAAFVASVVDKAEDRLDLTDEQRPEVEALRAKMAEEVRKPRLDMDTMEALLKERTQLFRIIMEEGKDDFVAFYAKLTDE